MTKQRAVANLVACLDQGVRPRKAWVRVPVLLPGEKASTRDEPARGIYGRLPAIERLAGVIDAAVWIGYAWADEPRCQRRGRGDRDGRRGDHARGARPGGDVLGRAIRSSRSARRPATPTGASRPGWPAVSGRSSSATPATIRRRAARATSRSCSSGSCRIPRFRREARPRSGRASSIRPRSRGASTPAKERPSICASAARSDRLRARTSRCAVGCDAC